MKGGKSVGMNGKGGEIYGFIGNKGSGLMDDER